MPNNISLNTTAETAKATCPVCVEDVQEDCEAVTCDKCDFWFHRICGGIGEKLYKKIQSAPINKQIAWLCHVCKEQTDPAKKGLPNSDNKDNTQKEDILEKTRRENTVLKETINRLNDELQIITQQLTASKKENIRLNQETISKGEKIAELYTHIKTLLLENTTNNQEQDQNKQSDTNQTISPNNIENKTVSKPHPNNNPDTLILGDSMIKNIHQYTEHIPNIQTHCMPGARVQTISKYLSTLQSLPATVIIHVGTNNLAHSKTPNDIMRPYWYTIEAAQKRFPNTIWIVHGILNRRDTPGRYINEVNEALRFMCENLHLVYRDPNEKVTTRGIGKDGLHLNRIGDYQLANFILTDLGLKPILDTGRNSTQNEENGTTNDKDQTPGPSNAPKIHKLQKNSTPPTQTTEKKQVNA